MHGRLSNWLLVIAVIIHAYVITTQADIPRVINYQGKLTDDVGVPVADGPYPMRFRIYDGETSGNLEWDSGALSVLVGGGIFSVLLGESPQPSLDLAFDEDYWLEVTVGSDIQSPRSRLASIGYAYMASGLVPGTEVIGDITTGTFAALRATNVATAAVTYGLYGRSHSSQGYGVYGDAYATEGSAKGVFGLSRSSSGIGVFGQALASAGTTYGVYGISHSASGYGVYGIIGHFSGVNYGVYGSTNSSDGYGIYGRNTNGAAGGFEGNVVISGGTGPNLIINDTNDGSERPGIQFTNNSIQYISGDDGSNEVFGIFSQFSNTRTYDASLQVHGKAAGDWGKYIGITHDGSDGKISTDTGNVVLEPAGKVRITGEMQFGDALRDFEIQEVDISDAWGSGILTYGGIGVGSTSGTNRQMFMFTDGAGSDNVFTIATSQNSGSSWEPDFVVQQDGRVGIGTSDPVSELELNGRLELPDNDATPTAGSGSIEIGNGLRIDGNELITNTGQVLYLQRDNGGDLDVDSGTLIVDASTNRVGVGTTSPGGRLHVAGGDLVVTNSAAYRGDIGPNNGAPFPRPAYDSGWITLSAGSDTTLTHGIGGDITNYVVDLESRNGTIVHNMYHGGSGAEAWGVYWGYLNGNTVDVWRWANDIWSDEVRVRIWVYN